MLRQMLLRCAQYIADSAYGVNHRLLESLVDLLAQSADMDIDHVGLGIEMIVPHSLQEHRARNNVSRVAHQVLE